MNKKVFISMIVLIAAFLVGMYVLKIFFPEDFTMVVQSENLIKVGSYIDNHIWLRHICDFITSFITYWLFLCACKRKLYLNWKEIIGVIVCIVVVKLIGLYDYNIRTHISISSFFILPMIYKMDLRIATIVYSLHGLFQVLSLSIRSLTLYLRTANYITILLMTIECYFWLLLLYIIFNYKKEIKHEQKE